MTERSLIADVLDELFTKQCKPDYVTSVEEAGHGDELWAQMDALGLTLPAVPEELGGQGATLVEQIEILRAAGRYAAPVALMETGFLAGWLLTRAALPAPPGPMTVAPTDRCEHLTLRRERDHWLLSGSAHRVPSASVADHIVVLAEDERQDWHVAVVDAVACAITRGTNVAGERRDDVRFQAVGLERTAVAPSPVDLEQLHRRASLGRAILMLGALETVRDLTVRHARERQQFGRPLASFQVVQHALAAIAREVALARAAVDLATDAVLTDDMLSLLEVASASLVCSTAATRVAAAAHQLHGAIGVTREHPLHAFTRRLWAWRDDGVSAGAWCQALGAELLSGRLDVWTSLAPTSTSELR